MLHMEFSISCSSIALLAASVAFLAFLRLLLRHRQHGCAGAGDGKPAGGISSNYCPANLPILGNAVGFIANRHRFLDWVSDLFAGAGAAARTIEIRGPFGLSRGVCTADPAVVDHLLRRNFHNYIKGSRYGPLSDLLGRGIFVSDGPLWELQRKTASREFTTRSLKSFVAEVVLDETRRRLIPTLAAAADDESDPVIDLHDVLRRFAFDTICRVSFGTDPATLRCPGHGDDDDDDGGEENPFFCALDEAAEISMARIFSPLPFVWKAKKVFDVGSERRLRKAVQVIDDYATKTIVDREEEQQAAGNGDDEKQDLLSRFMAVAAKEDDAQYFNGDSERRRRFLRDIVISFILAGKDTTSTALTWFFWLLSLNPRCKEMILRELEARGGDGELGYDELCRGLPYLHAALSESLRLYPPLPIDSRLAAADDVLPDGTTVKAGWFADYCAYAMARSEEIWGKDCREFVPERWLDGDGVAFVAVEPAKFPVFHAGPRTCLGKDMAYLQMKTVAAAVLGGFEVEPVVVGGRRREVPPEYVIRLTMSMKGGLPVRLKRRRLPGNKDFFLPVSEGAGELK